MSRKNERHYFRVRKDGTKCALMPASLHDAEYLSGYDNYAVVEVTIHRGRSRQRHRLYWATLHAVIENHDVLSSAESLHKMLLIGCGLTDPLITLDGEILLLPSSTAFDQLDEPSFKAYFDQAMKIITAQIIPGIDLNLLLNEAKKRSDTGERDAA